MTVSTTSTKIVYSGNGSTTVFPFSFSMPANPTASEIQVTFVDALGNLSVISPTAYTVVFNPPASPNPTPVGGSVTYNPGGIPIAIGTSLTIQRVLPNTQTLSLSNQLAFFQQTIESALDYVMMAIQGAIATISGQAIVVPPTDPQPNPLPPVAARANLIMGFDGSGNPIATNTLPTGGSISSAMAPVCAAATLVQARTNMGLGNVAVENIGAGLVDDGTGNLIPDNRVTIISAGSSFSITKASHGRVYINNQFGMGFNLTASSTYFNGFNFIVQSLPSGASTVLVNIVGGDAFNGAATGAAFPIANGSTVRISTNGTGTWFAHYLGRLPSYASLDNYSLSASVAAGALTITLKDSTGNTPSATAPIVVGSAAGFVNGTTLITSALSITVPNGATLGTQNAIPARVWVGLFSSAGTPSLGVYVALAQSAAGVPSSVVSWDETGFNSTTTINVGSNSPQTWYLPSGLGPTQVRILGYIEITAPTAGNWSVSPTQAQIFAPGNRKPGDVVQEVATLQTGTPSVTSVTYAAFSAENVSITLQNPANIVRADAHGAALIASATTAAFRLSRGTLAANVIGSEETVVTTTTNQQMPVALLGYDMPGASGTYAYTLQGKSAAGALTANTNMQMTAKEIFV